MNNDIVFLGRNEKKRGNSNKQHENIEESRLLTAGKTPLFLAKLFKLDQEKEGRSSYGFKPRTTKNFYTTQVRTREKVSRHHEPKTSVRLQKKITRKDFVFKDIIDNERLNSYGEYKTSVCLHFTFYEWELIVTETKLQLYFVIFSIIYQNFRSKLFPGAIFFLIYCSPE